MNCLCLACWHHFNSCSPLSCERPPPPLFRPAQMGSFYLGPRFVYIWIWCKSRLRPGARGRNILSGLAPWERRLGHQSNWLTRAAGELWPEMAANQGARPAGRDSKWPANSSRPRTCLSARALVLAARATGLGGGSLGPAELGHRMAARKQSTGGQRRLASRGQCKHRRSFGID